jgi:hypothetical protein
MAAAKHAVLHAANIDVWIRGADKVQGHLISSIVGTAVPSGKWLELS